MIQKIYRYKIKPGAWDEFLTLQKKVDAIYSRHLSYDVMFSRGVSDSSRVTEVHVYDDLASATVAEGLSGVEPALNQLFKEFTNFLDPREPHVHEEIAEVVRMR